MNQPNASLTWWPEGFGEVEIEQKSVTKITYNPKLLQKVSEFVRKYGSEELKKVSDEDIWERIKST